MRKDRKCFAHTYQKLDVDNENSFLFYQSEDADSGEFYLLCLCARYDGNDVSSGIPL